MLLKSKLASFYIYWTSLKPVKYILFSTAMSMILTIPFAMVFVLTGVTENDVDGPDIKSLGLIGAIIFAVIVAPILETFLSQLIPIKLVQIFVKWKTNIVAITVSALLFSLAHITYSIWYFFLVLPSGFILAFTYITFQTRKESSFWMTAIVHALKNLIAVLFSFGSLIK